MVNDTSCQKLRDITYSKPGRHGSPIEDDTPPRVHSVASHIHTSEYDGSEHGFIVTESIITISKEGSLTGIHSTRPVIRAEYNGG